MIIGEFIACATCKKNYRARIQVGLKEIQRLNFFCHGCQEPIHLTLNLSEGVVYGENCEQGPEDGATPQYLSDDIIPSADEVNSEQSFPSMRFMEDVVTKIGIHKLDEISSINDRFDFETARDPSEVWERLLKIWRLKRSGQEGLWKPLLRSLAADYHYPSDFEGALFQFLGSLRNINNDIVSEIELIKNDRNAELHRFLEYHHDNYSAIHQKGYYDLMGEYFALFSEFSKTFLYAKFGARIPENALTSAGNFNTVKKFYASAYEFYAASIYIFTCLNNIKSGRNFNELKNIDLKKYLSSDKAKRRDNFLDNEVFVNASIEFDNGIRNASFHNWMRLSDDNLRVEYNAGGSGELISMTYAEYLYKCSTLFLQCCELLQLELILWMVHKYRATEKR